MTFDCPNIALHYAVWLMELKMLPLFVVLITSKYQSSPYCKKELLYAENQRIPVIPCLMDKDPKWMPSGWLGYTIIDILYLDFRDLITDMSDGNLDIKCNQLISRIASTLGRTQPIPALKPLPGMYFISK